MATAKKSPAKTKSSKAKTASKKKPAAKKTAEKTKPAVQKVQLPSPITPLLAILAAVMTYVAFSLAIDSGSYWHYIAGFYFTYQTVRLTKMSIKMRMNDKG